MTTPVDELKVRARLRLNAARRAEQGTAMRLKDCLSAVSREVGFMHWEHAQKVLGARASAGDDAGTFWHAPRCSVLLNQWYARYDEAKAAQGSEAGAVLLPYRRQFIVANDDFVRELGLDPGDPEWATTRRDLVASYASQAWVALVMRRIKAPRESFHAQ